MAKEQAEAKLEAVIKVCLEEITMDNNAFLVIVSILSPSLYYKLPKRKDIENKIIDNYKVLECNIIY